jgi:hypothetical protein
MMSKDQSIMINQPYKGSISDPLELFLKKRYKLYHFFLYRISIVMRAVNFYDGKPEQERTTNGLIISIGSSGRSSELHFS